MQAQHPVVQAILDAVEVDSMIHYVEELSGEVPVDIGNGPELIVSRHKNNAGNDKAQAYLEQKLTQFGYAPTVQTFSTTGHNVIVTKPGNVYPDEFVILCAHFDAMPGGILAAPAADDDGSGTAALLEAARVMFDIPFEYTIVFGFWDEEEQGLVGSAFHAGALAANDVVVRGVVNMDAIAWDGNGDKKARVHTRPIANSLAIADTVFAALDDHGIDIDLILTNPGATYSDHASFWNEGYGAVLIIEEFTGDGNPHYHQPSDLVQYFDVPYYEKLAKLSMATCAMLAVPIGTIQSVPERAPSFSTTVSAFPNPTTDVLNLWLDLPMPQRYQVLLFDAIGREVLRVHDGPLAQGRHGFRVDIDRMGAGAYNAVVIPEHGERATVRVVRTPW